MLDIAFDFTKVTRDTIKNLVVKMLMNQVNMDSVFNNLDLMETFIDENIPDFALLRMDIDFYDTEEEFRSAIRKVQRYNDLKQEMEEHVMYNEHLKKELKPSSVWCNRCMIEGNWLCRLCITEKDDDTPSQFQVKHQYIGWFDDWKRKHMDIDEPELLGDDDDDEDFEEEGT